MTTTRAYHELPDEVVACYPWPGRYLTLEDGVRLHYLDEGRGEPLLMVHGNPTWSFYYRELVRSLSKDFRCIVPDHVGCGLSDKPANWGYRLADHVHSLERLIEHLDLHDVTLVMHDWGGAIGLGAAMRFRQRIKRLVLFNTSVFMGAVPPVLRVCRAPLVGPTAIRGLNAFLLGTLGYFLPSDRPRGVRAGYLAPYGSWDERVAILRFVQDIPLEADHPTRNLLKRIDHAARELRHLPALIIWGERDFVFTREYLHGWLTRLPRAEVHSLPNAGHLVVEDAPAQIVRLMRDFVGRHSLAAPQ